MNAVTLPSGPGFGPLATYLREGDRDLQSWSSDSVISLESAGMEMEAIAAMNCRLNDEPERALLHYTLSWPPDERPVAQTILDVARKSLAALGFDEERHQVLIVVHDDTPTHIHAHIMVNRVDFESFRLHSPRLSAVALDRFCRQMELDHGWSHSPGLHHVVDHPDGPRIVRGRKTAKDLQRETRGARDGELQSGLTSFQRWVKATPYAELRAALRDRHLAQPELHRVLAQSDLKLVRYGRGLSIVSRSEPANLTSGAGRLGLGLDYATFTARFSDLESPDQEDLPAPLRNYRDDVRNFAPDELRDRYERERMTWRQTDEGQQSSARWQAARAEARRERRRLRYERDRAYKRAKKMADPEQADTLVFLTYEVRKIALEKQLTARKAELRLLDNATGKPAATFFKWKRTLPAAAGGSGAPPPPPQNEIRGAVRFTVRPPEIPGFTHAGGTTGRDYFRDRLRVMVLKDDRVTLLSKDPRDAAAAARLARETYGSELTPTGDANFVALMTRLGVAPVAPTPSRARRS